MRLEAGKVVLLEHHATRLELFDLGLNIVGRKSDLSVATACRVGGWVQDESRPVGDLAEGPSR